VTDLTVAAGAAPEACALPVHQMTNPHKRLLLPLFLTLSVQGMIAFAMIAVPVLLPAYSKELGVGPAFAGTATAAVYAGAAFTALLLSSRARVLGAVRTCQVALMSVGAGVLLAAAGSVPGLLIGAFSIGLGYGPVTAASALLLTRNAPSGSYGFLFSVNRTSIPLGAAIAGALLPTLSAWIGWRGTLAGLGGACLLLAASLFLFRHLDHADAGGETSRRDMSLLGPIKSLFVHPTRRALTQASLAYLAAQSCLAAFTVPFLVNGLSLTYTQAGALFAGAQMAGLGARLIVGFAADRMKRGMTFIGVMGLGISVATGLAALAQPGWPNSLIIAIFLLYGASALGWNGVMLAELARTAEPDRAGELAGASSATAFAGAVAGPALFSVLLASIGYGGAFGVLSCTVLASSVAVLKFGGRPAVKAASAHKSQG
jgi:MFS family permease